MVGMIGVLGKGLVTGILYGFDIDNAGICYYRNSIHSFGTDNSKRRMSCSCIWMGLVTDLLYNLVRISEGVGNGNIIHFCYYNNSNRSISSYSHSNMIWISSGNVIGFQFSFWYMFGNI